MAPPTLEPAAQDFSDATSKPPFLFQIPPNEGRKIFNDVQKESISYSDGIETSWIALDDFRVKLIKPTASAQKKLPVVFYIHGGGWVFGSPDAFGRLLGELAKRADVAVFAIDYTTSPEARYPTALNQIWKAFEYIEQSASKQHNVDSSRIVIAGDSVGGNMTAVTSIQAQKNRVKGQILFYPVCDFSFDSASYKEFATGYFLQRDGMKWFFEQYTQGVDAKPDDPRISPLRTTKEILAQAPPALVITGEADVLRDHAEQFADKLRGSGVAVTSARFGGMIHDFLLLDPLKDTGSAKGARTLAVEQIKEWLH